MPIDWGNYGAICGTNYGNFASVDDLEKVSGIGKKNIEKNKADILLSDAATPATSVPPAPATDATKQTSSEKSVSKTK